MKNWGLFIITILSTTFSFSQTYPEDREKFVKAFSAATNDYLEKDQKDFIKDELAVALLKSTDFPDQYFKQMVSTCNLMESKRLKPYPEIYNYVFSVYSFVKNKQPANSFSAWHSSVDKLLDAKNINKFKDFIELSSGFFSKGMLASSPNEEWYFYGSYVFEYSDKPIIKFTDGRLVCGFPNKSAKKGEPRFVDSLVVYKTNGTYDPVLKKWIGKGGTVNWAKVGLKDSETFAELGYYDASMKSNVLKADTVQLTSPFFPSKKVKGTLNERAFRIIREADKNYPQFISFERKLAINNVFPDMDYVGGFSLEGASVVGLGNATEPAQLTIKRSGKKFLVAKTQYIAISPFKIVSNVTQTTFYVGEKDSVTHPGVGLIYTKDSNVVELSRGKSGVLQSPFTDSYHQLEWYVQKVIWKRTSADLLFSYEYGTSQEQRVARFESMNFYDGRLYDRLQGMDQTHPLAALYNYCYKFDEFTLTEGKAATALGKTVEQVKTQLLDLASYGFISYDIENKIVKVNQKTKVFIEARSGKRDYDNLIFVSDMRPKPKYSPEQLKDNAALQKIAAQDSLMNIKRRTMPNYGMMSLTSLDIALEAVDRVTISDAQASFVLPDKAQVKVTKNRDFKFSGWASAGKFETHTLDASYTYESNKINLLKTDRSYFRAKPLSQADGNKSIALGSALNGIIGEIIIDDPMNRSGMKKEITKFPILKSTKPSKVYYNQYNLFKGAYDSARFYYTCIPFEMDSLDNFSEKSFRLKGELVSAGIFPVIKEDLKIMADYSLGFSTLAPPEGHVFYGTKAMYKNKIVLSNNGLQGAGVINFIQSISDSKAFTFLPDSTLGYAKFENKPVEAGVQFPDVKSPDAYITYIPRQNVLKAASTLENELTFFAGEATMKGTAIIQPTGMTGYGIMTMQKASLGSDAFSFKRHDIYSDTSVFNLKNPYPEEGESPLAFSSYNVNAHISFKDRKGDFKSNDGEELKIFPVIKYAAKVDIFTWLMDQDEMELSKKGGGGGSGDININTDLNLAQPNMFSIHPDQDSLQFAAPKVKFSMKNKVLYCSKTEFIDVADARIYPDSAKVTIHKNALMDPLVNSKVVANYVTKYHTFLNAKTSILARRKYISEGDYPYYDADSTKTLIHMDKIGVDSTYQTIANGTVKSESGFKLNKYFDYYGTMNVKAANPLISFTGATRINHNCEKFAKSWMSFTAEIDPKNIQIPVNSNMKTLDGQPIAAGIVWRDSRQKDSIRLYPTFLSSLEDPTDPIFITATGVLQYDFSSKEFQIGPKEKLLNRNEAGNFLSLHTESCSMNGEGKINMGMDYGDITVDAVGTVSYNQQNGQTDVNATLKLNLPMDKGIFESAGQRIVDYEGSKPLSFETTNLEQALLMWSDRKTADKIKSDYTLSEDKKVKRLPEEMEKSIVITGVHLKNIPISKDIRGLMSNLDGAAIVNFYGKPVMRQVVFRSTFEQIYSSNGDNFTLMMQVPGGVDYLLSYSMVKKDGTMNIITSDSDLSSAINALKEEKRKHKNFLYQISTNSVYLGKLNAIFE
ncbi:hypothetical protein [Fluviicola taffensis]|uniref:Uncharacterized protein n=1 Tax=Fluviicola taffensis (strain DSM 16823 / NCIMB 13979 / RW262) TaxID=755732 RepID=F2I9G4_FLUTR|nr:hypothetical protein [Fluviicola taffensis]AEA45145.1 hypothetical protein Fluta_3171 [Fluviicola taffensis DSM 16823]